MVTAEYFESLGLRVNDPVVAGPANSERPGRYRAKHGDVIDIVYEIGGGVQVVSHQLEELDGLRHHETAETEPRVQYGIIDVDD